MFRRQNNSRLLFIFPRSRILLQSKGKEVLIIDGPQFATKINAQTALQANKLHGDHIKHLEHEHSLGIQTKCVLCNVSAHHLSKHKPTLAVVIVEHEDVGINFMLRALLYRIEVNAVEAGFNIDPVILPCSTTQKELEACVDSLNANPNIHGISIQRPLPFHLDAMAAVSEVYVCKDVEGLHHTNVGLLHARGCNTVHYPCSALVVKKILEHLNVNIEHQQVAVVGTSNVAGRPVSEYFLKFGAIVTTFGSLSPDEIVFDAVKKADIVVTACGQPNRFRGKHFRKGAIVIDFGLKPVEIGEDGEEVQQQNDAISSEKRFKLVGDVVLREAIKVCSHIVAPENGTKNVVAAVLLENTLRAYELCISGHVGDDVLQGDSFLWKEPGPPIFHSNEAGATKNLREFDENDEDDDKERK